MEAPPEHIDERPRTAEELAVVMTLGTAINDAVMTITDAEARDIAVHLVDVGFTAAGLLAQSTNGVLDTTEWMRLFEHVCHQHVYAALLMLTRDSVGGHVGEVAMLTRTFATLQSLAASADG